MTKKMNKTLATLAMLMCVVFANQVLADTSYDAGQFKFDMIMAKRGDADSQYRVGMAYESGRGTQKNLKQAFAWYAKAAQLKQCDAQYKLGYFYEKGLVVQQNSQKASEWYTIAAKTGSHAAAEHLQHQANIRRQEQIKRTLAAREATERLKRERQRKLAMTHHHVKVVAPPKPRNRPVAVKPVNIPDISDVVLNNKWMYISDAADYLPSGKTHCLRSSGSEIICFSDEKQRVVNGLNVTYTTKATISGFKADGTFQVKYNYNAIRMDKASSHGITLDPNGLKLEKGWQEPALMLNCRTTDRYNLYCSRGSTKLHYHR